MHSLDESGAPLAFGSDWPVSSGAPLDGIAVAVSRDGRCGRWTPQEILSVERALSAYTAGVAQQAFAEGQWGTIAPGAERRPGVVGHRSACDAAARAACHSGARDLPGRTAGLFGHGIEGIEMSTAPSDSPAATPPPPLPGEGQLRRALGVPSLVLFGMVYMVPLTVFTTYGIVTQLTGGRLSVAYLVTLAAMVFTARSYARMAAAYPVAGSAYAYTQKSFGAPIGFLAGWSLLLDYLFLPMLNYLVIGIYMGAAIPAAARLGFHRGSDRGGDGAQHRRHRLGGAGQLPAPRAADRLHRRVRGDGGGDDLW